MYKTTQKTNAPLVVRGIDTLLGSGGGQQKPAFRCGAHRNKGQRRQRTRSAQLRSVLKD